MPSASWSVSGRLGSLHSRHFNAHGSHAGSFGGVVAQTSLECLGGTATRGYGGLAHPWQSLLCLRHPATYGPVRHSASREINESCPLLCHSFLSLFSVPPVLSPLFCLPNRKKRAKSMRPDPFSAAFSDGHLNVAQHVGLTSNARCCTVYRVISSSTASGRTLVPRAKPHSQTTAAHRPWNNALRRSRPDRTCLSLTSSHNTLD